MQTSPNSPDTFPSVVLGNKDDADQVSSSQKCQIGHRSLGCMTNSHRHVRLDA